MIAIIRKILVWGLNIVSLIQLQRRGWKWFFFGVFMMFVFPAMVRHCL